MGEAIGVGGATWMGEAAAEGCHQASRYTVTKTMLFAYSAEFS